MAAGSTYTPIATTTLGSSSSSVSFSSFSGYTDLILIISGKLVSGAETGMLRFNSDTGTNYSFTYLQGNGSSASSGRASNTSFAIVGYFDSSNYTLSNTQIMNYSNATTYKTTLDRRGPASVIAGADVSLWRNTSAITSLSITPENGASWASGSTFTLYGIQAA
jgi:hypothetical protein